MIVSNVKLENFSGGEKHIVAQYTDIVIPAFAFGEDAIIGQIPADIAVDVLSDFVERCPTVKYVILGNEDTEIVAQNWDGGVLPRIIEGGQL